MTDLLDLLPPADRGTGRRRPAPTGIIHILVPDMGTLCREDYLEAKGRGDSVAISPHLEQDDRIEEHWPDGRWRRSRYTRIHWRNITCPWCRALGFAHYRHVLRSMSGR